MEKEEENAVYLIILPFPFPTNKTTSTPSLRHGVPNLWLSIMTRPHENDECCGIKAAKSPWAPKMQTNKSENIHFQVFQALVLFSII